MPARRFPLQRGAQLCLASVLALAPIAAQAVERLALLIGVGQYAAEADTGLPSATRLEGPPHDVAAMRAVLVGRWGFRSEAVQVLVDEQATRQAILGALQGLKSRSQPGDEVLVYFSGHGTSWLDQNSESLNLASDSGAWVPHDFSRAAGLSDAQRAQRLIRSDVDLKPVFRDLDSSGRLLWVISDSCFSGSLSRSLSAVKTDSGLELRMVAVPPVSDIAAIQQRLERAATTQQRPWPYRNAAFLLASAAAEPAQDIPARALQVLPTLDGKPHGAMTDALLRVLGGQLPSDFNRDGLLSLHEVQRAVGDFMAQRPYGHAAVRAPGISEDLAGAATRSLLSTRGAAVPPAAADAANGPSLPLVVHVHPSLPAPVHRAVAALPGVELRPARGAGTHAVLLPREDGTPGTLLTTIAGDVMLSLREGETGPLLTKLSQLQMAQAFRALGQAGQRAALPVSIEPSTAGSSRLVGDAIRFATLPDRQATVLLFNLDADGHISVLYPATPDELAAAPAGQPVLLPAAHRQPIRVQPPQGLDLQFAVAFDRAPEGFESLRGATGMKLDDARVRQIQTWLRVHRGAYTFGSTDLLTLPARAPCAANTGC